MGRADVASCETLASVWMTLEVWLSAGRGQLLQEQRESAYLVSADQFHIMWVNEAFQRFSSTNGGEGTLATSVIGRSLLDFIPAQLRRFYADAYAKVLASGEPARHDYECSSPDETRWFAQYILPDHGHLAIINTVLFAVEREAAPSVADWGPYQAPGGLVTQCGHCRRLKNRNSGRRELHAETFSPTSEAPRMSRGLCELCFAYFFGDGSLTAASVSLEGSARRPSAFRWLSEIS